MADAKRRAVLVDDNLMFAVALQRGLEDCGYQVETRTGGASIISSLAAAPPDLLVVNLAADRFDGPGLVAAVREQPALSAMPLLGYAGHVERRLFEAGQAAGADLVAPNSAMRRALPEVLRKLGARRRGEPIADWPEEDEGARGLLAL